MGNVEKHEPRHESDTKFLSPVPNLHTNCHLKNMNLQVAHHTGGKKNQSQNMKNPMRNLNMVCKSDVKAAHCILSNPLFKKNIHGQSILFNMYTCSFSRPSYKFFLTMEMYDTFGNPSNSTPLGFVLIHSNWWNSSLRITKTKCDIGTQAGTPEHTVDHRIILNFVLKYAIESYIALWTTLTKFVVYRCAILERYTDSFGN